MNSHKSPMPEGREAPANAAEPEPTPGEGASRALDTEPSEEERFAARRRRVDSGRPWAELSDDETADLRRRFLEASAHLETFRKSLNGFDRRTELSEKDWNRMLDLVDHLLLEFDRLRPGSSHVAGFDRQRLRK